MARKKSKRIMLTVDEDLYEILMNCASAMSTPASRLIVTMLSEGKPQLLAITEAIRLAKGGSLKSLDKMEEMADFSVSEADRFKSTVKEGNAEIRERKKKEKAGKK